MSIKSTFGISVLILIFMMGCAGSPQKFETFKINSDDEQKAILEKIKGNMADYDIYRCGALAVFNIKNDDKTTSFKTYIKIYSHFQFSANICSPSLTINTAPFLSVLNIVTLLLLNLYMTY